MHPMRDVAAWRDNVRAPNVQLCDLTDIVRSGWTPDLLRRHGKFPGRNGRRRRVLNEEVLSASSSHAALSIGRDRAMRRRRRRVTAMRPASKTIRRSPTSCRAATARSRMLVLIGVATTAVLGALHYFAVPIAALAGMPTSRPFDLAAPGSLAPGSRPSCCSWPAAAACLMYSIRRHRIDDYPRPLPRLARRRRWRAWC